MLDSSHFNYGPLNGCHFQLGIYKSLKPISKLNLGLMRESNGQCIGILLEIQ